MGQHARDLLDGTVCQGCGEWMDDVIGGEDAPGYPRWCARCEPAAPAPVPRRARRPWKVGSPGAGRGDAP